ncbi:MAG TPA: hypothetical protein DDW67_07530 [Elusimicrobia bacterium]|jgi:hypothetical protein|nr:hypothetical protein [Elusimicrobiota bacterium]
MLRKKRFYFFLLLAGAAAALWYFHPYLFRTFFRVSGTVDLAPGSAGMRLKPNTMLFVVARDEGGVPFAVLKVINPSFPMSYSMDSSDLILPELLPLRLRLEAFLNTHGEIGSPRRGDLYGSLGREVFLAEQDCDLLLDRGD